MTRPGIKKETRISFNQLNAEHIYLFLLHFWEEDKDRRKFGGCYECQQIGARLEKFIGVEAVKFTKNEVAKARRTRKREQKD